MQRFVTPIISLLVLLSALTMNIHCLTGQEFGPPPGMEGEGMPGGPQAAAAVPANSNASAASVRALLYPDLVSVTRFDTRRVNFPGLKQFAADFINGAIGNIVDEDKYLVSLRKTQKENIINGIDSYLDRVSRDFKILNAAGVGEFYRLYYEEGTDFCLAYAYPISGEASQSIISLVSRDKPITCFERFGFLIVVYDHSQKVAVDKNATAKKTDEEDEEDEEEKTIDPMIEKRKQTLPSIRARFKNPAKENAKTGKYLDHAAEALVYTDGSSISMVFPTNEKFLASIDFCKANGLEFPDTELKAALEKNQKAFQWATFNVSLTGGVQKKVEAPAKKSADEAGTDEEDAAIKAEPADPACPKIVLYMKYASPNGASEFAKAFNESVNGMRTGLNTLIDTQIKDLKLPFVSNPFDPMLGLLFNQLKPVTKGGELSVVFDCETLLENAKLFVPVFGGIPVKGSFKKKGKFDTSEDEEISFDDEDTGKEGDSEKTADKPAANSKPAPEKKPAGDSKPAPEKKPAPTKEKEEDPFS